MNNCTQKHDKYHCISFTRSCAQRHHPYIVGTGKTWETEGSRLPTRGTRWSASATQKGQPQRVPSETDTRSCQGLFHHIGGCRRLQYLYAVIFYILWYTYTFPYQVIIKKPTRTQFDICFTFVFSFYNASTEQNVRARDKDAKSKIRMYFAHIVNGVSISPARFFYIEPLYYCYWHVWNLIRKYVSYSDGFTLFQHQRSRFCNKCCRNWICDCWRKFLDIKFKLLINLFSSNHRYFTRNNYQAFCKYIEKMGFFLFFCSIPTFLHGQILMSIQS